MDPSRRKFTATLALSAKWSNATNDDINKQLVRDIRQMHGDMCHDNGKVFYLHGSTIEIIERSSGEVNTIVYDGSTVYVVEYTAEVCSFNRGTKLDCIAVQRNEEGIKCELYQRTSMATVSHPFIIILPIRWHKPHVQKKLTEMPLESATIIPTQVLGCRRDPGNTRKMQVIVEVREFEFMDT